MGFARCFRALLRRNMIYRKRRWISTIFEFILPIAAFGILVGIKTSVENSESFKSTVVEPSYPSDENTLIPFGFQDYVTALQAERTCVRGYGTGFQISGMDPLNWAVPFVKCDSRQCEYEGQDALDFCEFSMLALAPSSEDDAVASERIDSFMQYLGEAYPQLLDASNFPFGFYFVQKFKSSGAIDGYVTSSSYGTSEWPKVSVAVTFSSDANSVSAYNYAIRVNSTNFNNPENEARPASPTTPTTSRIFDSFAKTPSSACALQGGTPFIGFYGNTCTGQYMYNGALPIQRVVNDWIIHETSASQEEGSFVAENGVSFVYFPTPEYVEEGFYGVIAGFVPLLVVLGLLYPIAACIRAVVQEKELRQKELMKMMSVSEAAIGWSWFISLYGFLLLSGLATAAVSTALYSNSEFIFLFVFWAFALLGSLMFAFAVAACFSRSTRATLVGMLLYFAGYFLTLALDYQADSPGLVFLVSLHPVTSFSYGLQVIGNLEDNGVGLRSSTITFSDSPSGFAFNNVMASIILDCILWGLLTWYLNRVVKGDFGQPLPWYFVFTKSYWCPGQIRFHDSEEMGDDAGNTSIPIEPVSDALKNQTNKIEIRNLTKAFGEKFAVDGLRLSMYSGQVTALLGHNGAGKTTTINMLTGMVGPSSGYAKIAGKDIRSQMSMIREDVGICLQHDCLFPLLTVKEHLQFFARIKGVYDAKSFEDAEESVRRSIEDVALLEKRHTFSKDLSGGMKRKLSVAIAFCGDSKTVFLDEPTSGMDPFSRRFTWNVIRQYREERCIILTTHFMDEADLLGDRIAIMSEGQLRCVGSSLFLKKEFGVGYQLTVEKQPSEDTAIETKEGPVVASDMGADGAITNIVTGAVSEATLLSNVGTELSFQLPLDASDRFVAMFEKLDEQVDSGKIVTYGVSITTLDEVFLMVARGETGKEEHMETLRSKTAPGNEHADATTTTRSMTTDLSSKSFRPAADITERAVFSRHVQALFAKRAMNFKRDKKSWCCTTICPSLFALIGFLIVTLIPANSNMEPLTLSLAMNNPEVGPDVRNPIPFNEAGGDFSCRPGKCISNGAISVESTGESYYYCGASAAFGFDESSCTEEGYCGPNCSITESDGFVDHITDDGAFPVNQNVSGILDSSLGLADTSQLFAASQYGALYFTHDMVSTTTSNGASYADSASAACIKNGGDYTEEEQCQRFGGMGYVVSTNFTSLHASILYQAVADQAIIRNATAQNNNVTITPTIHPLPITKSEESYVSGEDAFTAWFLLVVSFPFVTGAFGTFIVAERQSKAKHLQTVSGVKPMAYWMSSYAWDILNYQLPLWIVVILMYATGLEAFTTNERAVASGTIVTLFLFGPASAGFTYCVSFLFKSPSMCNLFVIVFGFLIGMIPAVVIFILRLIGADPNSDLSHFKTIAMALEWVLRFFPPFNMAKALFFTINVESLALIYAQPDLSVWSTDVLLIEVIYLAVECFAYVALAIFIDKQSNNPRAVNIWKKFVRVLTCRCCCRSRRAEVSELQDSDTTPDEDVANETNRVISGDADGDLIVVNELSKVYDNGKKAVDHMSLGIPHGQCFGLLGINGAGKTTTMAMLTAEFPPSSGDATLAGFSVTNEPEQTRRRIGYCPQFDAHFANMTGREHVELYASIKGVPQKLVSAAAACKLAEVGLNEYDSNRLSGGYSGGMKRKLSVACATIGEPQMVFLDEPSTGMDPVARRDLWKVISDMVIGKSSQDPSEKTSVILTTHSMEECEALCPRIGIMAGGKLRCLGSAQRLKSRFGKGFQVEAKVRVVVPEDGDYQATLSTLLNHVRGTAADADGFDIEGSHSEGEDVFVTLDQALHAVQSLTGDDYISSMITAESPIGYVVFKNASSDVGITLDELTAFCVEELRVRALQTYFEQTYSNAILRERQESKVRYEVSSEGLKISSVFGSIEENKDKLQLSDYGVSQTSLEQIFNFFAAEAELAKQGTDDR